MTINGPLPLSALLRNTALEVSHLAQGATTDDVEDLHALCEKLTEDLASALQVREVAVDVARDVLYMQCALLDETVLACLPTQSRPLWEATPLQVERYGEHNAGEQVYSRLATRMREAPPNVGLLECYATVLGLGFQGKFAREGAPQRAAIIRSLDERLAKLSPSGASEFVVDATRTHRLDWFYRLSPWAIAGLVCAAGAVVFMLIGQGLDLQASHLLPAKA
ncbi:type VI secretion system protein ImpK [Paraburkholderia bannensis]|uniref:Type VI secretion system protein ImpK n=1 Tax=Paraburkholderia bannensis TaxID=765414 RepID=A0A7W9WUI2_9BURK|nr:MULTISPECIES: DotU/TssL family secretion system protein [Paraburkholderia]MBB3259396.1 type VI secretion system protein ImpK [Paraburkholderia sp. WP4_3_2]MBB6104412.1 type VI secretion system protein ImpK [Paraburkholderia bannensis]